MGVDAQNPCTHVTRGTEAPAFCSFKSEICMRLLDLGAAGSRSRHQTARAAIDSLGLTLYHWPPSTSSWRLAPEMNSHLVRERPLIKRAYVCVSARAITQCYKHVAFKRGLWDGWS